MDMFVERYRAFKARVSGLDEETQSRFAQACLRDTYVFTVKPATTELLLNSPIDLLCTDLFNRYEEVIEKTDEVTISRQLVRPLLNERQFDQTINLVDTSNFTIIGGSYNPRESMVIQPKKSSEVFELSEYESLYDASQDPDHVTRYKNIHIWIACSWFADQEDPELDPMAVKI